jgi:hypothetical protein
MDSVQQKHPSKWSLTSLFYCDFSTIRFGELRKRLREYKVVVSALHAALQHFNNKDFEKFDALVGENACQIRAVKIAILSTKDPIPYQNLEKQAALVQGKLEALLQPQKILPIINTKVTLQELIQKEGLDIVLTEEEFFILNSFLLCLMKEPQDELSSPFCIRDMGASQKLKEFDGEVSLTFANRILKRSRRLLSEASVRFAREMAWSAKDASLIKMISNEFTHEINTWPTIPMFWTYKTLLKVAIRENVPIILHTKFIDSEGDKYRIKDEEMLFFKPHVDKGRTFYSLAEPTQQDLNKAAVVVQGVVDLDRDNKKFCKLRWRDKLIQHPITEIILAGAADHRQYPNESYEVKIHDPEFEKYKGLAQQKGFSLHNPTLFLINHVYSVKVDKLFVPVQETVSMMS